MNAQESPEVGAIETSSTLSRWIIGDWTVTPDNGEMQRGTEPPTHVAPKHLAVLCLLAEHAGECVSRQDIIDSVWTRNFVQDEVLTRIVADLRKLLGNSSDGDAYIATVPKRGYRLVAPVRQVRVSRAVRAEIGTGDGDAVNSTNGRANHGRESILPPHQAEVPGAESTNDTLTMPAAVAADAAPARGHRWRPVLAGLSGLALISAGAWLAHTLTRVSENPSTPWSDRLREALPAVAGSESELMPRWIDDGHAFVYVEIPASSDRSRVMRFDLDRREKTVLIDAGQREACPMMSPNGKHLIWTRLLDSDCSIMLKLLPDGPVTRLAACDGQAMPSCPSFGANAEDILFTAPAEIPGQPGRLSRQNLLTGKRTDVLPAGFEPGWEQRSPRLAPDGRRLAFELSQQSALSRIMVQSADGHITQVLAGAHDHHGFAWSPDGAALLISSNALKFPGLLQVGIDPVTEPKLLGSRGARRPDIAPSGAVLFEQHQYQINLWAMQPGDAAPSRLTDSQYHDALPKVSPDGEWLLFSSNRSGLEAVWLIERKTAQLHAVSLPADQRWLRPAWSLAPRQLTATRYMHGEYEACGLNWVQAEPDCPASMHGVVQSQELLPGQFVLEREQDGKHHLAWLGTDRVEQPIASNVGRWRGSGQRVVYADDQGGLHLSTLAANGDAQHQPIAGIAPSADRLFSLHGDQLCWLDETAESARLYCRDLDGPGADTLRFPELPIGIRDFDVSPNADWLVFERTVRVQVDLFAARSGDSTP
ncbi:hypothetical protein C7S18_01065 [Ahniella affigens]|uniref:OmpR/PhoB-type domain-containing protein n=1 Tax=Ahniella affigens TaxID=2021234 RepID=A0A2P1PM14_9GAMM|nr:winged helix-turn-helix domain-containing protein [Ahniella affigens]AVP95872.1 hypothetical protein C7S18_01065 [Ahniella affigens]